MKTTIKELAEKHELQPAYVNGFVQTLLKLEKAVPAGKVKKPEGSRGKPPRVYEIDDDIFNKEQ